MILARDCDRDPADRQALIELLRPDDYLQNGSKKGMVKTTSSTHQLVCRLVFKNGVSERANSSNASRYGKSLDEAAKRQIEPTKLYDWLKVNGGVEKLFKARPVTAREVTTRYLQLTRKVTFPKHKAVTLVLRMNETGHFDVLEASTDDHTVPQDQPGEAA